MKTKLKSIASWALFGGVCGFVSMFLVFLASADIEYAVIGLLMGASVGFAIGVGNE